jgi:hypothetical protein
VRRLLVALALVAGSVLAPQFVSPAVAVSSATNGVCQSAAGVTVVVDFSAFGQGVETRCVSSATSSTSGVDALQSAGFTPTPVQTYGLAFVCRIDGLPGEQDENCKQTPPASAYWSYWYASNGGSWTYSSQGPASHKVKVGGFEGWRFHSAARDGNSTKPPALTPTRPTIKLGPAASTTTHHSSTSPRPTGAKPTASKATSTAASATSSAASTSATATPTDSGTSNAVAGGALPGDPPDPGRSPWPFVVGAAGIGALLSGAYLMVLRRRGGI